MADFILYGTDGCHLCEEAVELVLHTAISFEERDIVDDSLAMQLYSLRIPVLRHVLSGAELGWPFDDLQLAHFIAGK